MNDAFDQICDIQARLARISCPFCADGKLDLVLRCDVHADRCLFIASCQFCGMRYDVDLETTDLLDREHPAQERFPKMICPRCGSAECTLNFRCSVASRRCAYEVLCAACADE